VVKLIAFVSLTDGPVDAHCGTAPHGLLCDSGQEHFSRGSVLFVACCLLELKVYESGCHDNHIYQYDMRANGQLVQDYDRHLGPVNSITLIEGKCSSSLLRSPSHLTSCPGGKRFVSTSDDKTIRYWETGIGVDIKTHQVACACVSRAHSCPHRRSRRR
jgi:WD40 repeat protein